MAEAAKRYKIEKLLMEGVRPLDPLTPEVYDDLKRDIIKKGKRLDLMPVHLSADDVLYDGHNRLRILLDLGRKTIGENEIKRNQKLKGRRAAYFEAVKIQFNRRNTKGDAKAAVIWEMVREYGMSQTAIGKELDMRQQSVSELMKKYPSKEPLPDVLVTVGEDGKTYTRTPLPPPDDADPPPPRPRPFEVDGSASLTLRKARKVLADNEPIGLDRFQRMRLRDLVRDLGKDCANFLDDYLAESDDDEH